MDGRRWAHATAACSSRYLLKPCPRCPVTLPLALAPPSPDARLDLIMRQLGPGGPIQAQLSPEDLGKVVARTSGYSG